MELINRHKKRIVIILVLLGFFCAGRLSLQKALAEDNKPLAAAKADPNSPEKSTTSESNPEKGNSDSSSKSDKTVDNESPADPNLIDEEDDTFLPKLSTLVLLQETYDRIFTPELITDEGLVKYSTLRRKRADLINAGKLLKDIHPAILMGMSREEKIAFWINAYNVCTLRLIIDNYPIEPKVYMIWHPDNSIMQISGAWTKHFFWVSDEQLNLKEIEKEYLLQRYKDPRICFATSNSTKAGAIISNQQYKGDTLETQLDNQVKKFLSDPKRFRLDPDNREVHLSHLFKMNKAVFLESEYARIRRFREREKPEERAWLNFIVPYLSEEEAKFFDENDFTIKLIDYDWELNETK